MNSELTLQLVENHRQFLGFLERRLGDRGLAEDLLQDAFVKRMEKPVEVRDETSSIAWFYRTLRNAVIDHYRRNGARNRALPPLRTGRIACPPLTGLVAARRARGGGWSRARAAGSWRR